MPNERHIRATTDEARSIARNLLTSARTGALGVLDSSTGFPSVTRVAAGIAPDGRPVMLVSELSKHTRALRQNPVCSLMLGEIRDGSDPLAQPRISLAGSAVFVSRNGKLHREVRTSFLSTHEPASFYVDFPGFSFVLLEVETAFLNAGFGQAYDLTPKDLQLNQERNS